MPELPARFSLPGEGVSNKPPACHVAIRNLGDGQFHVGIVYHEKAKLRLLHFAWHYRLETEPFTSLEYACATPPLSDDRMRFLSALCRRIAAQRPRIPYAIRWRAGTRFSKDGSIFVPHADCQGLTCATFILAVFGSIGVRLLDELTWKTRPSDIAWQRSILGVLEAQLGNAEHRKHVVLAGELKKHIEHVRREVGSLRYRPEEVAGACTVAVLPADFEQASRAGLVIRALLTERLHSAR